MVELVELPRYHEKKESDKEHDRQTGLRVRRANVTVADRAVHTENGGRTATFEQANSGERENETSGQLKEKKSKDNLAIKET